MDRTRRRCARRTGVVLPSLLAVVACGAEPVPARDLPEPATIPCAEASRRIAAHLGIPRPDATAFPVRDTTSPAVWQALGLQVFRVLGETERFETFLIRGGAVHRIGAARGGPGIVSFCVADVDGDGDDDLAFAFASGDEPSAWRIGWADLTGAAPVEHVAPRACQEQRLRVRTAADGAVEVVSQGVAIGRLDPDGPSGARISLSPGVDPDLLDRPR